MRKRIFLLILTLVLLCTFSLTVCAHEVPDESRLGSVSVSMTYQGEPICGGTLTAYRVAQVKTHDGDYFFEYTADFAECTIPLEELESAELADELARIAKEKALTGTTVAVDAEGKAKFADLELGVYLVVQEEAAEGFKKINPFLVSVPQNEDGRYVYDVDTAPKNLAGPETEPTDPPTDPTEPTKPDGPDLPQTGQTNWPIPVLTVAGLVLLTAGLALRISGKKDRNEA